MGQLFDQTHIAYILISLSLTVILLVLAKRNLKTFKHKMLFFNISAILTFFLHISILWVDFFRNGSAGVPDNILFPIFFCNLTMYLMIFVSLYPNKNSKLFNMFCLVVGYGGFFGAMISLMYPSYYLGAASMFEWGVFKSMLSHSTMLLGSTWLIVGGFFKIKPYNAIIYFVGLLFYGLVGIIVNQSFSYFGLYNPNAMYLDHPPLSDVPILNFFVIAMLMVLLISIFGFIYQYVLKSAESKLKENIINA
jgi:hypothetical protein